MDVFLQACLTAMVGTLGLYLDPQLTFGWCEASLIVSKSQGHGIYRARKIRQWIHQFLATGNLPLHHYRGTCSMILGDEDIASQIQLLLSERAKQGFIKARDVVNIITSPEIQEQLRVAGIQQRKISECTGREWLRKFRWRYGKKKNGMYIDGHEREDVVAYQKGFVERFAQHYAPCMYNWDCDGRETKPSRDGFTGDLKGRPFRLILVTHDESTFYANDERKARWYHESEAPMPVRKGEGTSIMASDFLTSEWGRLTTEDGTE